jgi:hypothetical protein
VHDRVAEAVLAGILGRAQDADELVERMQRVLLGEAGGRSGEPELRRVAGHGGAPRQRARAFGQQRELVPDRGGDRARDGGAGAAQLEQVERVAAAQAVELACGPAEQRIGVGRRERLERDVPETPAPRRGLDRPGERRRQAAIGDGDEHAARRLPQELGELFVLDVVERLHAPVLRAPRHFLQQMRLADAGLPMHGDERAARVPQRVRERLQLFSPADDAGEPMPPTLGKSGDFPGGSRPVTRRWFRASAPPPLTLSRKFTCVTS